MLRLRNPGHRLMNAPIVHRQFVIEASQQRVWDLLGRTVYRCLPLEKMNAVSETTAYAVLRLRLAFISLPLNVKVELVDISPPSSLGSKIWVKKRVIKLVALKVTFTLRPVDEGKTEVVCTAMEDGRRTMLGWLVRGQQRSFTEGMFDSIRARLEQFC